MLARLFRCRAAVAAIVISSLLLVGSVALPAFGGPAQLDPANALKTAKRALSLAKKADSRSKNALRRTSRLRARTGPAGPRGPQGGQGPPGPLNVSALTRVVGPDVTLGPNGSGRDVKVATAFCPQGQRVISGGHVTNTGQGETFLSAATDDRTGWAVGADNDSNIEGTAHAIAYCAGAGNAIASRAPGVSARRRAAARREFRATVARQKALDG